MIAAFLRDRKLDLHVHQAGVLGISVVRRPRELEEPRLLRELEAPVGELVLPDAPGRQVDPMARLFVSEFEVLHAAGCPVIPNSDLRIDALSTGLEIRFSSEYKSQNGRPSRLAPRKVAAQPARIPNSTGLFQGRMEEE